MTKQTYQQPLRILLVDDSPHDYAAFQRAFEKSDITAHIAYESSAEPALQRIVRESTEFDLVVTDYRLGGMTGLELCREILRLEIPIALVILTGSGSEDLAVEALKAGVDDYLIKDPDHGYFRLLPVVLPEAVRRRNDRMVRRFAEEAIAAGEERLHHVLDAVGDGAWDWNVQTGRLYLSPRFYQTLRYEPDGIAASEWTWADLLHPDDRDDVVARIDRHVQSGDEIFAETFRMQTPDNRNRWVLSKAVVIERTPDNRPFRIVGVILDVTDNMRAEDERDRLLEKLETKNKELERFSRVIRHQFGPPLLSVETFAAELTSVMDEVRQLLAGAPFEPAEKYRLNELLNTGAGSDVLYIDSALKDMRRLLDGLAELIAVDQRRFRLEPIDMDRLLGEVRAALHELLEETAADLRIEPLPPCRADHGWTRQIFTHLLSNALRNLDPDRPGRIAVTGAVEDDTVLYCVQDNGVGIEPARQQSLFDLLPPAPEMGHGLGLSIVARILDRLDGRIRVESEPGRGSRFYVELPAAETIAARARQNSRQDPGSDG